MNKIAALASIVAFSALPLMGRCAPPKAYHSSAGFSIVPPTGWKVMDPSSTQSINDIVVQQFKMKMGPNRITLALFDPKGTIFTNNINVVVNTNVLTGDPTQAEADKYASELQSQLGKSGLKAKTLYSKIATFSGHHAIEAESQITLGGMKVHDLQVLIVAKKKRFVVTCSAGDEAFQRILPIFLKSVHSIKIDGDSRR